MDVEAEWARVVSAQSAARMSLASEGRRGVRAGWPLSVIWSLTSHWANAASPDPALLHLERRDGIHPERMHLSALLLRFPGLVLCVLPAVLLTSAVHASPPRASAAGAADRWEWPLGSAQAVARGFVAPPTRYSAGHRGIDLKASPADPVQAPAAGVVSFAGNVAGRPVLSIAHPGDLVSSFEPVLAAVAEGDRVSRGAVVGTVASGGHCDAACLHFGVRLHGEYVSPLLYLAGVPRAVLLPVEVAGWRR